MARGQGNPQPRRLHRRRPARLRPAPPRRRPQQEPRPEDPGRADPAMGLRPAQRPPAGIGRPPWEELGIDDYLPAATTAGGGENTTEPLAEQTIGPLLIWAMRMVDDLSGDILAAWAERQRLIEAARAATATPAGHAALEAYLRPLIASQAPLPATTCQRQARASPTAYIGGITGASRRQVDWFTKRKGLAAAVARRPGPCPLDIPVTGRIAGRPWRAALDFNEAPALMRHLGTAAFIVCAYLTGMRPGEILGLRTGCCPDPVPGPDGQPGRHLIRGLEFKTATDERRQPPLRRRRARGPLGRHHPGRQRHPRPGAHGPRRAPAVRPPRPRPARRPAGHRLPEAGRAPGAGSRTSPPGRTARQPATAWPARPSPPTRTGSIGLSALPPQPGLAHRPPAQRAGRPGHPVRAHAHRASATGQPRDTPPAAATASTTSSTWRPPARPPTPSPPCTTTSRTAAASPAPPPAAPSGPPPRRPASPAPPSPSPAPASC